MANTNIKRALLSVTDKTGLREFARFLSKNGVEILSTGGTARAIRDTGIDIIEVSDFTDFPEILGGRVKTLHPKIHGGILARRDHDNDQFEMVEHDIQPIDLIVVNLYAFEKTVSGGDNFETCVEHIDIGGPALIRAAAKNHLFTTVVIDPQQYQSVMIDMEKHKGKTSSNLRRNLAATAYARTAAYDAAIAGWFGDQVDEPYLEYFAFGGKLQQKLRYGENPHQTAAFYTSSELRPGVSTSDQIQGKALSYNNLNDTDAAYELVAEFDTPACAIIKHANPCGVALGETLEEALKKAVACDPVSAFGGIIALNRSLDTNMVKALGELFVEVIVAPEADENAIELLSKRKNLRLLLSDGLPDPMTNDKTFKQVAGGFLLQSRDNGQTVHDDLKVVTKRAPTVAEIADLLFAFTVGKHVKSNTIVYARDQATVGIGAGQMSRVDAAHIAARKGNEHAGTRPCVVASDAFFPFADGLLAAIEAGGTAVIQPGGSIRDDEVIAAADDAGIAMVFTGMRHFRH
ncbi:MAG: Bifunctional purine biosynthesis protein PurH [Alphaproteobacteria bacterium MarineAlpha4_Bin2]|nr:MAG: Bifunctional purine biosynthesis protein PurH [Alphaproteobacteria bacterium MarineAlpha4_Bin2]